MITKSELINYSKSRNITNLGFAEKDYYQNLLLFIIYQNYGKDFVFKGGTALGKCFGLFRFSEDLDFNCDVKPDLKKLDEGMKRFRIEYSSVTEEYSDGLKVIFKIKGPLYSGISQSFCKLILDISLREKTAMQPEIKTIGRFLEEIPSFEVFVMHQKEILAEKVRAIMTRNKARDMYDLHFLLDKNIDIDLSLITEKLNFYDKQWTLNSFIKSINNKKDIWISEMTPLVGRVPLFNTVKDEIIQKIKAKDLSLAR